MFLIKFQVMKRSSKEALKGEGGREINKASVASITSSAKSAEQNLERLYKTIRNSAKNERGKKLRLEKASVSYFSTIQNW